MMTIIVSKLIKNHARKSIRCLIWDDYFNLMSLWDSSYLYFWKPGKSVEWWPILQPDELDSEANCLNLFGSHCNSKFSWLAMNSDSYPSLKFNPVLFLSEIQALSILPDCILHSLDSRIHLHANFSNFLSLLLVIAHLPCFLAHLFRFLRANFNQ